LTALKELARPTQSTTMGLKPLTFEAVLYQLLRDANVKEFNRRKADGEKCDLTSGDFRHLDLRGLDATGLDFSNSYFRGCDLRGIDFSQTCLEGASINGARISGVYFPPELSPEEIVLSIEHGTRLRYKK